MSRRFVLAAEADSDMVEIISYVATRNESAAARLHEAFEQAFRRLAEFSELGADRQVPRGRFKDLRMWPLPDFPNYVVYYRPMERGVEVVRVLHASRDRDSILHDDE